MSLGVLNNLNATYAENNLNNSSNSLSKVLNELSSGSKINSGADDAAGLSLVDGLQANQQALTQSKTNATEGVGLLQVADGALSQVTSLLNRAVTLATEASNGTLNSSQDTAANQEYQSILSEISNIGSTTTYNDQSVFGTNTSIYTGDASTTGSSIDALDIRTLSSSNVGDSGGVMAYSNGANNVFLNMSSSTKNAQASDSLSGSSNTVNVTYLVKGSNGSETTATTSISVGGASGFQNTVGGLISAINNSGLGLTASLATQAQAGVQGGGTQIGIEIAGGLVSAGVDPNAASTSGILNPSGIPASELLTQGQKITINQGGAQAVQVTVSSDNTLAGLANAINTAASNGGSGNPSHLVTASVITNSDGSQSLSLANSNDTLGALTVTTTPATVAPPSLGTATTAFTSPVLNTTSNATGANAGSAAQYGTATYAVAGTNAGTTALSAGGTIVIQSQQGGVNVTDTFIVGSGPNGANTFYTANSGDGSNSMSNLAATIQAAANLHVTATATSAGLTVKSATEATGYNVIIQGTPTLTNASNQLDLYSPTDGGALTVGSPTTTGLVAGNTATVDDQLSGTITFSADAGLHTLTFTAGTNGSTYSDLVNYINAHSASLAGANGTGVQAAWSTTMGVGGNQTGIVLTSNTNDGSAPVVTVNTDTLSDATTGLPASQTITAVYGGANAAQNDTITGEFKYTGNGHTVDFNAGAGNNTYADLATAINGANVGLNATWDAGTNSMLLTSNALGAQAAVTPLVNTVQDTTNATGGSATVASFNAGATTLGTDFVGGSATFAANGKTFTYTGDGTTTTFANLATALSQSDLGVTASFSNHVLTVTSATNSSTAITMTPGGSPLTDEDLAGTPTTPSAVVLDAGGTNTTGSAGTPVQATIVTGGADGSQTGTNGTLLAIETLGTGSSTQGTAGAPASHATAVLELNQSSLTNPTAIADASDTITGQITLTNGLVSHTFIQGTGNSTANTIYTGGTSISALTTAINADNVLGLSATAPGGGSGAIYLQAVAAGTDNGGISASASTLADVDYSGGTTSGVVGTPVSGATLVSGNAGTITVGLASGAMTNAPNPSATVQSSDTLAVGSTITVGFGAASRIFDVGTAPGTPAANTTYVGNNSSGATLSQLAQAITAYSAGSSLGVTATAATDGLELTSTATGTNQMITATANLTDNTLGTYSHVSLSGFGSENDTVSGTLNYQIGGVPKAVPLVAGETVQAMLDTINTTAGSDVTATWNSSNNSVLLTSTIEGSNGNITPLGTTNITDTTTTANLTFTGNSAYSTGLSGAITDSTTQQATAGSYTSDSKGGSGTATISYSDAAGQSLSATDLSNQADAQSALTSLNVAITDVAAQDGYIGAQINTLNAVNQVLSTQQENVQSAQNAVQATDYASATSDMSKYEILSQTGIAALAQANSIQQEVTKLLQ